ncbi:hypothetical protein VaNZ11_009494 [Volvox africanus]|uniref:Peptidase S8/S53 domain-containing protein n=1 Tax=Volvox africanus TaxID=51714 RepID=A0ABQ5S8U2_9CHLO|nr:hypothetical protein VaNZ11_009494 [Volvox africanus]
MIVGDAKALRSVLSSGNCFVAAYIPNNTLLVYGKYSIVLGAAKRYGALMGEYIADYKRAPELNVITAAMSAITERRRRRRRRLGRVYEPTGTDAGADGIAAEASAATGDGRGSAGGSDIGRDGRKEVSEQRQRLFTILRGLETWSWRSGGGSSSSSSSSSRSSSTAKSKSSGAQNPGRRQGWVSARFTRTASTKGDAASSSARLHDAVPVVDRRLLAAEGSSEEEEEEEAPPQLYGINVYIVPGLPVDMVRSIILDGWMTDLSKALQQLRNADVNDDDDDGDYWEESCSPKAIDAALYESFSPRLQAYFCAQDIEDAVDWLSRQSLVTWLEPVLKATLLNAAGGWLSQTGALDITRYNNLLGDLRPFWKAGIMGNGSIIGVTDSGLDMSHCMFMDDNYSPAALQNMLTGSPLRWFLPNHRKVVQYAISHAAIDPEPFYGDEVGHGTHVCGTVAGARGLSSKSLLYTDTGSAPAAKLSVIDVKSPNSTGQLVSPELVESSILPSLLCRGADQLR